MVVRSSWSGAGVIMFLSPLASQSGAEAVGDRLKPDRWSSVSRQRPEFSKRTPGADATWLALFPSSSQPLALPALSPARRTTFRFRPVGRHLLFLLRPHSSMVCGTAWPASEEHLPPSCGPGVLQRGRGRTVAADRFDEFAVVGPRGPVSDLILFEFFFRNRPRRVRCTESTARHRCLYRSTPGR